MAQMPSTAPAPLTEDAFVADRQSFWSSFTTFITVSVIVLALIIILMAIFLV